MSAADQDAALLGRTAAERLFARLDGGISPPAVSEQDRFLGYRWSVCMT